MRKFKEKHKARGEYKEHEELGEWKEKIAQVKNSKGLKGNLPAMWIKEGHLPQQHFEHICNQDLG